jgi:2-oxo-hept-3-ene-1,7-dioate hydratase
MLTDDERRQGAQLLFDAERQRKAIPQLSKTFPGIEIVDAYRIQDLWAELKMAPGVGVAGHKIGLTSRGRCHEEMSTVTSWIVPVNWKGGP